MPDNCIFVRCNATMDPMVKHLPAFGCTIWKACSFYVDKSLFDVSIVSPRQFKDNNKPYVTYYVLDTNGKLERQVRPERNLTSASREQASAARWNTTENIFDGSEPCITRRVLCLAVGFPGEIVAFVITFHVFEP